MSGAIARYPAPASAAIWCRQRYDVSGKPWSRRTGVPSPASTTWNRRPFASTVLARGSSALAIGGNPRAARRREAVGDGGQARHRRGHQLGQLRGQRGYERAGQRRARERPPQAVERLRRDVGCPRVVDREPVARQHRLVALLVERAERGLLVL